MHYSQEDRIAMQKLATSWDCEQLIAYREMSGHCQCYIHRKRSVFSLMHHGQAGGMICHWLLQGAAKHLEVTVAMNLNAQGKLSEFKSRLSQGWDSWTNHFISPVPNSSSGRCGKENSTPLTIEAGARNTSPTCWGLPWELLNKHFLSMVLLIPSV